MMLTVSLAAGVVANDRTEYAKAKPDKAVKNSLRCMM
jgi:hypothetical protein